MPVVGLGHTGLWVDDLGGQPRASSRATIVKAYKTVRGSAVKHVKAALPALGELVQGYMQVLSPQEAPRCLRYGAHADASVHLRSFRRCPCFR